MRPETRFKFNAYLTRVAELNGISTDDVSKNSPSTVRHANADEQSAGVIREFLQTINNILPVAEMKGEKIGVGVIGTIASTTGYPGDDERKTADFTALESNKYECDQINF
ncbi:P2 family phage major capsid protein [Salmonella enterica subsp. enterica serovar Weltevreden]|nr:P2 family phage major capsid protein [Salmonella enterica subsp. enterica serovar Weltevreden]